MKKIFFCFAFFLCTLLTYSQTPLLLRSALSTGGASTSVSADGTRKAFPQSIGQNSVTGVFNRKTLELRQGFIQPIRVMKSFPESEKKFVSIYPNPFSSMIFVKLNGNFPGNLELKINDLAGRQVHNEKVPAEEISQVNLGSLSRGVYILTIRNGNIRSHYKIIKN